MLSLSLVKLLTCGVIRSSNFASAHVMFSNFLEATTAWPTCMFCNMRQMDFPPETFKASHSVRIPCNSGSFKLTDVDFHALQQGRRGNVWNFSGMGPKQFIIKSPSSIRIHWDVVKGQHYMSNRKNPGNTKYVFDGHWFMEIDGNC